MEAPEERNATIVHFLVHPEVVKYIDFKGLPALRCLCKLIHELIDKNPEDFGYWKAICNSYCYYAGLYSHTCCDDVASIDYKKYFFSQLWTIRGKWDVDGSVMQSVQEYKIKVVNRFRPGALQSDKVCLPLHQFLKVKRHQRAELLKATSTTGAGAGEGKSNKDILVGEKDPEDFTDPLLGTLMKDPVLLTSSNRVVDRSVAVQCVLRGGRDPFNSERLTMSMLIPQPDLTARINEFRLRKQHRDVSLGLDELRPLVDDGNVGVDADLLDALMEVERIQQAARKAEAEARLSTEDATLNGDVELNNNTGAGAVPETDQEDGQVPGLGEDNQLAPAGEADHAPDFTDAFLHPEFTHLASTDVDSHYNNISKRTEHAGVVEINDATATVSMHVPGVGVRPFHYATVHKGDATQQSVYMKSAQDSIAAVLNGFNACLMCYGQTGSGKTYTFFGPEDAAFGKVAGSREGLVQPNHGVVMRACEELLRAKEALATTGVSVVLTAQFVEIYEEVVTDLLTGNTASVRRETGQVVGAFEAPFDNLEQMVDTLRTGHERKRFAATEMNERSSRSHTALIIHVQQKLCPDRVLLGKDSTGRCASLLECAAAAGGDKLISSQLHLIDLAGSERIKKSKVEGVRLREAVGINSSLLVLGKVIASLVQGKSHIPYFESKLTMLLKAAFGGSSRTTVLINCRTDKNSGDETLQSMRFGERCAMVSNTMRIAASSFQGALAAVDASLATVRAQLSSLEGRNKQHLPTYKALLHSYQNLERKRVELVHIQRVEITTPSSASAAPES